MRTIVAPLGAELDAQLAELDAQARHVAQRYIRRLWLEPHLGVPIERGLLAEHGCRRVYFDRDDRPENLFGDRAAAKRRGDQDLSHGPRLRIVYSVREAPRAQVRVIRILAVGEGHPRPPWRSAYELAHEQLRRLIRKEPRS